MHSIDNKLVLWSAATNPNKEKMPDISTTERKLDNIYKALDTVDLFSYDDIKKFYPSEILNVFEMYLANFISPQTYSDYKDTLTPIFYGGPRIGKFKGLPKKSYIASVDLLDIVPPKIFVSKLLAENKFTAIVCVKNEGVIPPSIDGHYNFVIGKTELWVDDETNGESYAAIAPIMGYVKRAELKVLNNLSSAFLTQLATRYKGLVLPDLYEYINFDDLKNLSMVCKLKLLKPACS
jgi:hypothetical protein